MGAEPASKRRIFAEVGATDASNGKSLARAGRDYLGHLRDLR